jgi:hypothetical protein
VSKEPGQKEPGQIAYEAAGGAEWLREWPDCKGKWAAVESAVRADATRGLIEALERIANVTENWADNLASQVNEIACAALEKAKTPPAV